jgi:hypothetical protein
MGRKDERLRNIRTAIHNLILIDKSGFSLLIAVRRQTHFISLSDILSDSIQCSMPLGNRKRLMN